MLLVDTLLIAPFTFVLRKIAEAVDAEMNDESRLKEELLAAQMRLELGEITDAQFADLERAILTRLREIRARSMPDAAPAGMKVTGIEATLWDDDGEDAPRHDDRLRGSR